MQTVLFIDDIEGERELRERLYKMHERIFHGESEFLSANSWESGLAIIRARPVDVLLLDLIIPPMGREETLEAMATTVNLPPVVILTGIEGDPFIRDKCILAGADSFIQKKDANHWPEMVVEKCYEAFLRRQRDLRRHVHTP